MHELAQWIGIELFTLECLAAILVAALRNIH